MWIDLRLPMDNCDFFICFEDLPPGFGGVVVSNGDGTYTMVLNRNRLHEQQVEDYWHEYKHLAYDDFNSPLPIEEVENVPTCDAGINDNIYVINFCVDRVISRRYQHREIGGKNEI